MNLKHVDGVATCEGPSVELGAEEKYFPTCYKCYCCEVEKGRKLRTCCGGKKVPSSSSDLKGSPSAALR